MDSTKTFDGQVKWFDFKKGFGFIQKTVHNNETKKDEQVDIFVHFTHIKNENEFKMLYPGEHVVFEETDCPGKGTQAMNVRAPFDGKLMHDFKNANSTQKQSYNNYENNASPWNSMFMLNLGHELVRNASKGVSKGKGFNGKGFNGKGSSKGK